FTGATCNVLNDQCEGVICQNNGTCEPTEDGYFCYCQPGYTGPQCENMSPKSMQSHYAHWICDVTVTECRVEGAGHQPGNQIAASEIQKFSGNI
ncbi:EGF-like domain protein, partial [Teladorsagia circumcincta]